MTFYLRGVIIGDRHSGRLYFMFNKSGFSLAGETITGLVRKHNEDNFLISAPAGRCTALAAVADGVGGHRHGEIVSYISCRDLGKAFNALTDEELLAENGAERFLLENIDAINKRVFGINYEEFTLHPMSSTLVAVLFLPGFAVMANVGDSRFYLVTPEGQLEQISTDHTLANEDEFKEFREKFPGCASNTISRSIGARYNLKIEIKRIPIKGGERFFLCSDGVYRDLETEDLRQLLATSKSPHQCINRVMRSVLLNGARDNTTIVSVFPGSRFS